MTSDAHNSCTTRHWSAFFFISFVHDDARGVAAVAFAGFVSRSGNSLDSRQTICDARLAVFSEAG